MSRNRSPVTRRQALAAGVGATIGGVTLPRQWFKNAPKHTTQIAPGSWPMERYDPARTGYAPDADGPTQTPDISWQATVADEDEYLSQLVCSEETVYAATEHTLTAVTAATGKRRWQTKSFGTFFDYDKPLVVEAGPSLGDGQLLLGSYHNLYAVDQTDGSARWKYRLKSSVKSILRVGNTVYVVSGIGRDASLMAIDIHSGLKRWKTNPSQGTRPYAYAHEYVVGQVIDHDQSIGAVDVSTGMREWKRSIGISDSFYQPSLCIANGTIYCGTGPLYALNLTDGSTRWSYPLGTSDAGLEPVSDGSAVYFVLDDSVRALDAESGELRWRVDLPGVASIPTLTDGTLYVGLEDGLAALDSTTGNERFRVTVSDSGTVSTSPIIAGGTVYLAFDQTLYALTAQ
jgi:outer membrane protein assembly factor BamB